MEEIRLKNLSELSSAASQLLDVMKSGNVVVFYGEMGAGKTTLIKELCRQLDVTNVVSSPTFSLVNEYNGKNGLKIFHFDFYRINKLEEAFDFGYEEYFYSDALCLVEWPEKVESLLPANAIRIRIEVQTDRTRLIKRL